MPAQEPRQDPLAYLKGATFERIMKDIAQGTTYAYELAFAELETYEQVSQTGLSFRKRFVSERAQWVAECVAKVQAKGKAREILVSLMAARPARPTHKQAYALAKLFVGLRRNKLFAEYLKQLTVKI